VTEAIVFPDVEDLLRIYLADQLEDVFAFTDIAVHAAQRPTPLPDRMVFLRRTGGTSRDIVTDLAQVTVEAYGRTGSDAILIAQMVQALMGTLERDGGTAGVAIHDVQVFSGPYLDPDQLAPNHYRYSATYQAAVRGTAH
jgi:hypothetical protein